MEILNNYTLGVSLMVLDINKLVKKHRLTKTEESILLFIIENTNQAKKMGVRGIAKEHYTSTTTVMNLAKKLGYSGFLDMYYNLSFILRNQKNNSSSDDSKFYDLESEDALALVDQNSINNFVDLLIENKNEVIYATGRGFSAIAMNYIARKLLVLGFKCIFSDAYESYDVNSANGKLLLVGSKSGETEEVVKNCKSARNCGMKVASFTGESDHRVGRLSDINFKIHDAHPFDDRNKLGNSFFPNLLMLFEFLIGCYLERVSSEKHE